MAEQRGGVQFNRPSLVAVLYLMTYFTGLTALVGVILAYMWRKEPEAEWEASHWPYLINTFWIALGGALLIAGALGAVVLVDGSDFDKFTPLTTTLAVLGVLLVPAWLIVLLIRCIRAIANAQVQRPMPRPGTLLF